MLLYVHSKVISPTHTCYSIQIILDGRDFFKPYSLAKLTGCICRQFHMVSLIILFALGFASDFIFLQVINSK